MVSWISHFFGDFTALCENFQSPRAHSGRRLIAGRCDRVITQFLIWRCNSIYNVSENLNVQKAYWFIITPPLFVKNLRFWTPYHGTRVTRSAWKKTNFYAFFGHACVHQYIWVPPPPPPPGGFVHFSQGLRLLNTQWNLPPSMGLGLDGILFCVIGWFTGSCWNYRGISGLLSHVSAVALFMAFVFQCIT